jgi:hypothetical protein
MVHFLWLIDSNPDLKPMKIFLSSITLIVMLAFSGCQKLSENSEVEDYIDQLINGQVESYELPAFTSSDIPYLLRYRNETTLITDFPRNPISSFWQNECKLGMYVLWTIESIRAVETNSDYLIGRFPSQNPVLALRDAPELHMVFTDESHSVAAKAYLKWWNSFTIGDKMKIDPLKDTRYRWH